MSHAANNRGLEPVLPAYDPTRPIINVTGGHSFANLPDSTVVADDHVKISERQIGDPVQYRTSDGVGVLGVVTEIKGLSLIVSFEV